MKKIAMKLMALGLAMIFMVMLAPLQVEARDVSKQEQILFMKEHLETALKLEEEYKIPHQNILAEAAFESNYGTTTFAQQYHNLTGYACYPDEEGGPVVCHEAGQFESDEECLRETSELLADKYGMRGYMDSKGLAQAVAGKYCPDTPDYGDKLCAMIDTVNSLESEVVEMQEAAELAEAELQQKILAELGDETIYVMAAKDSPMLENGLTAGASAVVYKVPSVRKMTVQEAAEHVLAGNFGDYAERKAILGENYEKVREYLMHC